MLAAILCVLAAAAANAARLPPNVIAELHSEGESRRIKWGIAYFALTERGGACVAVTRGCVCVIAIKLMPHMVAPPISACAAFPGGLKRVPSHLKTLRDTALRGHGK